MPIRIQPLPFRCAFSGYAPDKAHRKGPGPARGSSRPGVAQPGLRPPPTEGGVAGAGVGSGAGSGAGSASSSGAAPPALPSSSSAGSSVVSSSSYSSYSYSPEEELEVWSLSSSDSSGRVEGSGNSGQSPATADSMKERQIGPAVGPP